MWWKIAWRIGISDEIFGNSLEDLDESLNFPDKTAKKFEKLCGKALGKFPKNFLPLQTSTKFDRNVTQNVCRSESSFDCWKRHFGNATAMLHPPVSYIIRRHSSFRPWQIEWIFIMKWKFLFISLPPELVSTLVIRRWRTECSSVLRLCVINLQICLFIRAFLSYVSSLRRHGNNKNPFWSFSGSVNFNFNSPDRQLLTLFISENHFATFPLSPAKGNSIFQASSATVWTMKRSLFPSAFPHCNIMINEG